MAIVRNIQHGGNGGGSNITVVANYSALPNPTTVSGKFYWCSASQGTSWLPGSLGGSYYNSGMYYSNGTTWEFLNVPYNATLSEVNTGTNNDKFVTPSTLSNSNWSFTTAKALATLLTGISFATGGTIVSTDSILVAFGKIQKQINDLGSTYQAILTDVNFGAFSNGLNTKSTIVDADTINISDSSDSNKSKKVTWTNIKAFLKTYFDTLYVNRTSWIDISATSTIVGFSVFTTKQIYYKKIDTNLIQVKGTLSGTSNSALLNFTIPFTSVNSTQNLGIAGVVNNGASQAYLVNSTCNANSNVVNIYRDNSGTAFTALGPKSGTFSILIEIQ